MKYLKVKSVGQNSWFIDKIENVKILDIMADAETGEDNGYVISIVEMATEEFESLPEFSGF